MQHLLASKNVISLSLKASLFSFPVGAARVFVGGLICH